MNLRLVLWLLLAGLLAYATLVKAENIPLWNPQERAMMNSVAGETPKGLLRTIQVDDEGRVIVSPMSLDSAGALRPYVRTVCELKMEAAMRAMNTFSIPTQRDQLTDQEVEQWLRAKQLWEATKKDCWTTP